MDLNLILSLFYILVLMMPLCVKLVHFHTDLDTRSVPAFYVALSSLLLILLLHYQPKLMIGFVLFTLISVFGVSLILFETAYINFLALILLTTALLSYLLGISMLGEFLAGLFFMSVVVMICRHTLIYED